MAQVLEELQALVIEAQRVLWADQSGPALAEAVQTLTRLRHQFDALDAMVTSAFDASKEHTVEGHATAAAYLVQRCGERPATAKRRTRVARALRTMPQAAEALAAGEISLDRVDLLARTRVPSLSDDFVRHEERLVGLARQLHYDDFVRALRYWADIRDTDDADRRIRKQDEQRQVNLSDTFEGMGRLDGWLTPIAHRIVASELERLEKKLWEDDWAEARDRMGDAATRDDLIRTPAQRRHDALVEMAMRSRAADGSAVPTWVLNIKMDAGTFATQLERHAAEVLGEDPELIPYPDERECELDDGTILTPSQAIALGVGNFVRRLVIGPDDELINLGREQRFFLGPLRDALKLVVARCTHRFGCDVPSRWCEIDHRLAWIDGGRTDAVNGGPLCKRHNLWKELDERDARRRRVEAAA